MSAPESYEGSIRPILHLVPQDGTGHEMLECYCHPRISEANATAAAERPPAVGQDGAA